MPGAWEIKAARDNRVLLGFLVYPDPVVSFDFTATMRALQLPPGSTTMRMAGMPFGPARNQIAKTALEGGYNLAFLDIDVRAQPDAYMKLFETGLDIVSGLYYQKFFPFQPVMFNEGRDAQGNWLRIPITGWTPGNIVPCTFVPAGLLLVRLRLLQAVFARWPRPFEWGVDTAPVPAEDGQVPGFCVLPGQDLYGSSPVETTQVGEELYDQFGGLSKVTATYQREYQGDIIEVIPRALRLPVRTTPEHQFLVKLPHRGQPVWLQAKDLTRGMFLAFPQLREEKRETIDLWPFLPSVPLDHDGNLYEEFTHREGTRQILRRRNLIPRHIPLTDTFMELCGWFVAEGSTSRNRHEGRASDLRFSLGPHETQEAQWILASFKETFNLSQGAVCKGDHALIVYFQSPALYRLFKGWFGSGAENKHVPAWVLSLPGDRLIPFLRGLWRGDGHQTYSGRPRRLVMAFRTKSEALALDVTAILIKLGIRPTMRCYRQHKTSYSRGESAIYHITVYYDSARLCKLLDWPIAQPLPCREVVRSFIEEGKFWFPIEQVRRQNYSGPVYDLTVTPGGSYILGPAITHNSEDFVFSWRCKQLGVQPFCHTGVVGLHEIRAVVGPRWIVPYPSSDPLHGVIGAL